VAFLLFYLGLGALLTFEEAGLFFMPGDISLVAAGLHATPTPMNLFISWLVASSGMVVGSSILFHGVSSTGRMKRVLPARARRLIRRHGVWGVGLARMVPGLRNATVFAAASSRMKYPHFLVGLIPAALAWSGLLLLLGWYGGAGMLALFGTMHDSATLEILSLALLGGIGTFVVYRLWIRQPSPGSQTP